MLIFNDVDLEKYLIHEDIEIQELADRTNTYVSPSSHNGDIYTGYRYSRKVIKIPFKIDARKSTKKESTDKYVSIVRQIKRALHTDSPAKLYLPDEINKYYYAVVKEFSSREIFIGVGEGEIVFECFDPYAYSNEYSLFECDKNKITTVKNNGTANCSPVINVTFTKDAHFFQCTNWDDKTILIGNRPSVDDKSSVKNELVLHDPCEETTEWLPCGNVLDTSDADKIVEGNVTISADGSCIVPSSFGSTVDQKWHGAAVRRNIGENITDFEVSAKIRHNSKKESTSSSSGTTVISGNYKVNTSSLNVRSGRGKKYSRLGSVKKNDVLNVTNISKGWGQITFRNKTGYVYMSYLKKNTSTGSVSSRNGEEDKIYTENKMGRVELYGFDKNGKILFRIGLKDSEQYYEYTQPEVYIGSKLVLHDKKTCPKPKKKTITEDDKKKTISTESGRFGDWNEYFGECIVRRETKNNKQYWTLIVTKWEDGKEVKNPRLTKVNITSSDYPTEDLNHVVLWFGKHKDDAEVDDMGLSDLKVRRINPLISERPVINFTNGDELEIDCGSGEVKLNGANRIDLVDIGSEFFTCDTGDTQFICQSDDKDIDVVTVIQEKWL